MQKKDFAAHKKTCKKESATADELWAKHESRIAKKMDDPPKLEKVVDIQSRHDPNEIALLKKKSKQESLGVLLKGGDDDFNVEPMLVNVSDLLKVSEPAHLIQEASKNSSYSLPLVLYVRGSGARRNEAANKLMTRIDTGLCVLVCVCD